MYPTHIKYSEASL